MLDRQREALGALAGTGLELEVASHLVDRVGAPVREVPADRSGGLGEVIGVAGGQKLEHIVAQHGDLPGQ